MESRKFRILIDLLQQRKVEKGDLSPEWLLGFLEGYGKRHLTGYQIGALMDLILINSTSSELIDKTSGSIPPVAVQSSETLSSPVSFNSILPPR